MFQYSYAHDHEAQDIQRIYRLLTRIDSCMITPFFSPNPLEFSSCSRFILSVSFNSCYYFTSMFKKTFLKNIDCLSLLNQFCLCHVFMWETEQSSRVPRYVCTCLDKYTPNLSRSGVFRLFIHPSFSSVSYLFQSLLFSTLPIKSSALLDVPSSVSFQV